MDESAEIEVAEIEVAEVEVAEVDEMAEVDEVAQYNIARWQALATANAPFTRPALELDRASAYEFVNYGGLFGEVAGKEVLCLAGGGGQQSAAFALLGAKVTVFDLSEAQLERDRQAAAHYEVAVRTVQGDMRDLSALEAGSFDIVYQPYSLGFVPDARVVFAQVARVLRPGGIYYFACCNPFYAGLSTEDWNGTGYNLRLPYVDGARADTPDAEWVYSRSRPEDIPAVRASREYRQTLSKLLNSLFDLGFTLFHLSDSKDIHPDPDAEPGAWDHFVTIAPPWLAYWLRYQPQHA